MVTDKTNQIGCGISTFIDKKWKTYLLACNYATRNVIGCPVYKTGPKASACSYGPDAIYTGLCKTSERIDSNAAC